jgi:hypothetical protein
MRGRRLFRYGRDVTCSNGGNIGMKCRKRPCHRRGSLILDLQNKALALNFRHRARAIPAVL